MKSLLALTAVALLACGSDDTAPADESGPAGTGGVSAGEDVGAGGVADCQPACGGLECGIDAVCGTVCGVCAAGFECTAGACTTPEPPAENGETCSHDSDCASGHCGESARGERRCYGNVASTGGCNSTFDCSGGVCIHAGILASSAMVCSTAIPDSCSGGSISGECADFVVTACQLALTCDGQLDTAWMERCIQEGCVAEAMSPPLECADASTRILDGRVGCL